MNDVVIESLASSDLFDAVYDQHRQSVYAYFFGHTGDEEAAADLLQETFLRAWRNMHTLQAMPPEQQRYWLFGLSRNLLTDHYRRHARKAESEQPLDSPEPDEVQWVSAAPTPDVQVERSDMLRRLNAAIAALPQHLRTVLSMHVLGEMNSAEIGEALDIPAGTVRYQLSEARKRLAGAMQLADRVSLEQEEKQ
jgi:RNA polymerase sigma-70 factor (ECF subfamily)